MSENIQLSRKILLVDNNAKSMLPIKAFFLKSDYDVVSIAQYDVLLHTMAQRRDISGIVIIDEMRDIHNMLQEIGPMAFGTPIFILSDHQLAELGNESLCNEKVCVFPIADYENMLSQLTDYLDSKTYSADLLLQLEEIGCEAIKSNLSQTNITTADVYLASDRRIYGNQLKIMNIRTAWCEGVVMLQADSANIETLISENCTSYDKQTHFIEKHAEDLLREIMNQVWGGFKQRFVSANAETAVNKLEVPISLNYNKGYVSFGIADPLLCYKFIVADLTANNDSFEPFPLFLKFSFHIFWDLSQYAVELDSDDIQTGELEMF